jgi:antimicrobial peptide system SdpA family protein
VRNKLKPDWIFLLVATGLFFISVYALSKSIREMSPPTAMDLKKSQTELSVVIPQGWNFFTASPRDPRLYCYKKERGVWNSALVGPKSRPGLGFGWIRAPRAQLMEVRHVLSKLDNPWSSCAAGKAPLDCIGGEAHKISNEFPHPTMCGEIVVVSQEPLPWLWAKEGVTATMSSQIAHLEITCSS